MATASTNISAGLPRRGLVAALYDSIADVGAVVIRWVETLGDMTLFMWRTLSWLVTRMPRRDTLVPAFYNIGVLSLPVIALTGTFIGMVLAVQSYTQFKQFGFETRLGALINLSMCRELGPVLAATMLAGRVGSAIAAEVGTMRVTEQIDALTSMGANPIHYLVVPRFLGCLLMIPSLTVMAIFMGVVGGWILQRPSVRHRFVPLLAQLAAVRRQLGLVLRHLQKRLFRRDDRHRELLPRFPLRAGGGRRRPGGDRGVRAVVRHHPDARFVPQHRPRPRSQHALARGHVGPPGRGGPTW